MIKMATKSILKNININDKRTGYAIVSALENSKRKKDKDVTLKCTCEEIKGSKIKQIFGDK